MKIRCDFCNRLTDTLRDKDFTVKVVAWKNNRPVCRLYHYICWEMQEGQPHPPDLQDLKLLPPAGS